MSDDSTLRNDQEKPRERAIWIGEFLPMQDKMVSAITQTSDELSGSSRRRLRRLADEIAFGKTIDDVLKNPVALEIYLTLAGRSHVSGPFDPDSLVSDANSPTVGTDSSVEENVETAVNRVLNSHLVVAAGGQRIWTLLVYPLTLLSVCFGVLVGISTLLVPTFEKMFGEFGLSLPGITVLLFGVANAIRSPSTYIGLLAFSGCVGLFAWLRWGRGSIQSSSPASLNLRGGEIRSTRGAWADWAWHVSLLLRAGVGKANAISIASEASGRAWLQRGGQIWAQETRIGERPFHGVTHFRGVPCHLLADALALDDNLDQSAGAQSAGVQPIADYQSGVLREVAEIYWDRDRQRTAWQLGWLPPVLVFAVGLLICFSVIALFAPMVQLITGLT